MNSKRSLIGTIGIAGVLLLALFAGLGQAQGPSDKSTKATSSDPLAVNADLS